MRIALIALLAALAGCGEPKPAAPPGDVRNGKLLLRQFGCGTCHAIPGVADAIGRGGPPLAGIARRTYLAGVLPVTPDNMAAFIREPRRLVPHTTMPDLGVSAEHARDMVAYLYTLE